MKVANAVALAASLFIGSSEAVPCATVPLSASLNNRAVNCFLAPGISVPGLTLTLSGGVRITSQCGFVHNSLNLGGLGNVVYNGVSTTFSLQWYGAANYDLSTAGFAVNTTAMTNSTAGLTSLSVTLDPSVSWNDIVQLRLRSPLFGVNIGYCDVVPQASITVMPGATVLASATRTASSTVHPTTTATVNGGPVGTPTPTPVGPGGNPGNPAATTTTARPSNPTASPTPTSGALRNVAAVVAPLAVALLL